MHKVFIRALMATIFIAGKAGRKEEILSVL
jgi:hypothetical protein